jgi:hypothetical protein
LEGKKEEKKEEKSSRMNEPERVNDKKLGVGEEDF